VDFNDPLHIYGSDAASLREGIAATPALGVPLHPALPFTPMEVIWSARHEMARTVEDILARRQRALFLDARAAVAMAPRVASILAEELGKSAQWQERQVADFNALAAGYYLH
jgi:glycerol-3-phosphate dehydrogenase